MRNEEINGVGPSWFPTWLRKYLTKVFEKYFLTSTWIAHDKAYTEGGNLKDKFSADYIFYIIMLSDLEMHESWLKRTTGFLLANFLFISVVTFGSFSYHFK